MKITRIDPALPVLTEVRPARGVATEPAAASPLPARIGAALASPDAAGALRVLVEEVRTELQARLGPSAPLPPARPQPLDGDAAVAVLLRYLRAAARGMGGAGDAQPEAVRQAVETGLTRARALLAGSARLPPTAMGAVEQVIARVRAAAEALAPRPPAAPAAAQLPGAMVREISAALSERIGMLPAAAASARPPQGPREALVQLAQVFRAVAEDSVLGVRASQRVAEAAVSEGVQRALASLPSAARSDPTVMRLSTDLAALALRSAVAPGAVWPAPRTPAAAMALMVAEFRQALGEWTAELRPGPAASPPPAMRDAASAVGGMAAAAAEALAKVPPAQVIALRAVLESAAQAALGRSLLQLAPAETQGPARAVLEQLHVAFRGLLAAADSAATGRGLDSRGWVGLLARAGETMQHGGAPPFRFDLPVAKAGARQRRPAAGAAGEAIDAIESSDPEAVTGWDEDDRSPGPPLWPRPPSN
ncbi:MAG: hypothetical protein MUC71_07430 [Steroidobacteraceae bacterium]|jgi:hypothetical protein|nr:hypothetical protein [Steroidobacteraceae bacterium]